MLSFALVFLAAAGSPEATLARVQAAYQKGELCAAFTQTYVEKVRARKKVESGKLWARRDGRVRWTYEHPEHKDFVYDGKYAWFYEPASAQVTQFEKFEQSPLWSAVRFLWGQGRLTDSFAVGPCTTGCPKVEAGVELLLLTPKKPLAAVDHVLLEVDPASAAVRRSTVYDSLGNRTEYAFEGTSLGCKVPDEKLRFEPPPGVSVVRASGDPSP